MLAKRSAIITAAAFGALLATAAGALAQDVNCSNTTLTGYINGNVSVSNGSCSLAGVVVTGNVTVGQGANLAVYGQSIIGGNIQANNCGYVYLNGSTGFQDGNGPIIVGGNVQVQNCSTSSNPFGGRGPLRNLSFVWIGSFTSVPNNVLNGNLLCRNNFACVLLDTVVSGNVQISDNADLNGSQISYNIIMGNLQCQGNTSVPTGGVNIVLGNEQGQCPPGF